MDISSTIEEADTGGRKRYRITDAGQVFLTENRVTVDAMLARMNGCTGGTDGAGPRATRLRHTLRYRALDVVAMQRITPHPVRVTLGGDCAQRLQQPRPRRPREDFLPRRNDRRLTLPTAGPDGPIWPKGVKPTVRLHATGSMRTEMGMRTEVGMPLLNVLRNALQPTGDFHAWIGCESAAAKAVRAHLIDECGAKAVTRRTTRMTSEVALGWWRIA